MQITTSKSSPRATASITRSKFKSIAIVGAWCIGLSAIAVIPFFFMGNPDGHSHWTPRLPDTHDMFLHLDQMKSFYRGLQAKEIYPRWEIETNRGFGAPTTSYYPPGIYYVTALFYYLAHSWLRAIALSQLAIMIASAIAMYLYARRHMSRPAALLAMGVYAVMPYHLIDEYHRGALAELLAFVWMPLLLYFIDRAFDLRPRGPSIDSDGTVLSTPDDDVGSGGLEPAVAASSKNPPSAIGRVIFPIAGIAISYGAFVWSHPPTAYQFSLALAIAIPLMALAARDWRGILLSGLGVVIGLGLAAAYVYPAAAEKNLITNEYVGRIWPYHQSYVFVKSDYYGDNPAFFQLIDRTWMLNLAIIVICAGAIMFLSRGSARRPRPSRTTVLLWAAVGCFTCFMMTTASYRVGSRIPMIDIGVFSWRMLGVTSLAGALLTGGLAQAMRDSSKGLRRTIAAILMAIIVVGVVIFNLTAVFGPIYNENLFQPEAEHFNYAMLPKSAPDDPEDFPKDVPQAEIDGDDGVVTVKAWEPQHRVIEAELRDSDQLFVRTFNFPGWTATVDGQPAEINTGEDYGDIEIDLDEGRHTIVVDYLDTPVRKRAKRITIGAALLTGILLIIGLAFGIKQRPSSTAVNSEVR
ncbi:MAG TPA: glycosyltransferase family 39 protein [Blastocatellia bacterium]|nr:glycosyltransferase family 39 protein [Blastocatellia bacterium]